MCCGFNEPHRLMSDYFVHLPEQIDLVELFVWISRDALAIGYMSLVTPRVPLPLSLTLACT